MHYACEGACMIHHVQGLIMSWMCAADEAKARSGELEHAEAMLQRRQQQLQQAEAKLCQNEEACRRRTQAMLTKVPLHSCTFLCTYIWVR